MSLNESPPRLNRDQQIYLLDLARLSIRHGLAHGKPMPVELDQLAPALSVRRASFVTLERHGELRGCIGSLEAIRPLAEDIARNAYAAAFRDPRFPPITETEVSDLEIHLSLLTPPEPLAFSSEQELIQLLRPGIDGLILEEGHLRGTFLPSVWESLPNAETFLFHLKRKAGLPADYWSDTLKVYRYQTEVIGESERNSIV